MGEETERGGNCPGWRVLVGLGPQEKRFLGGATVSGLKDKTRCLVVRCRIVREKGRGGGGRVRFEIKAMAINGEETIDKPPCDAVLLGSCLSQGGAV